MTDKFTPTNIDQLKRAKESLRILQERLATVTDAAGAVIYDWDVRSNTFWRSATVTPILGWSESEIGPSYEDWARLRPPADQKRFGDLKYADFLQPNDRYVLEYQMQHKDGHYVWLLDSGRVFRDDQSEIIRVAGAAIEITQRKSNDESLIRLAKLVDLSFEPIFVWHTEKGIMEWNRGAENLYGYTRHEAIGQSCQKLLQTQSSTPDSEFQNLVANGQSWSGELAQRAKDGRTIFVESRRQAIGDDGDYMILETNHDITDQRQTAAYNARMSAIALASHDALFGISLEGIIETWNPAATRLFGYEQDEVIGKHARMLADAGQHQRQAELITEAGGDHTVGPYEARRLRKDGSTAFLSIALAPVKALDGSTVSISVAMHDISDRREWEAQQRLMTRELAHRSKNSFAVLQSILRSTLRSAPDAQAFAESFSGRLQSLSAAQDILSASNWRGAELGELMRLQLAAHVEDIDRRVDFTGPEVNLPAEYAAPFGLIFNELATNAVRYGALSVPSGNLQIFWRVERLPDSRFTIFLTWRERGGPSPLHHVIPSLGANLIVKSLPSAKVQTTFAPEGLTCQIEITMRMGMKTRLGRKLKPKK